jgi:hypothetical protein
MFCRGEFSASFMSAREEVVDIRKVGQSSSNDGLQHLSQRVKEGDWPICLGLRVVVLALLPKNYRNSLLEVLRAVS